MLPVIGWRLYYADGSTFSSTDGPWSRAPLSGVQVLALYHELPYRTLIYGGDTYTLPGGTALSGSWMPEQAFYALVRRAEADAWP